jgi:hypothetical protein
MACSIAPVLARVQLGRVVHVVGAEESRGFLGDVIDLVGDAAGRNERQVALDRWREFVPPTRRRGFIPRDARETRIAAPPQHRIRSRPSSRRRVLSIRSAGEADGGLLVRDFGFGGMATCRARVSTFEIFGSNAGMAFKRSRFSRVKCSKWTPQE